MSSKSFDMSTKTFEKKFGQLKQMYAEKAGKAQKSEIGEDFKQIEAEVELKRDMLEKLVAETRHFFGDKAGSKIGGISIPISSMNSTNRPAKAAASTLGSQMLAYGSQLPEDSAYGESLMKTGEAFEKLGDIVLETENKCREEFLKPMSSQLEEEYKELQHQRKKLENRRLDYDAKQNKYQKSKKPELEGEMNEAKAKFEESVATTRDLMVSLLNSEEEELRRLVDFVVAQRQLYEDGLEILNRLGKVITDRDVKIPRAKPPPTVDASDSSEDNSTTQSESAKEKEPIGKRPSMAEKPSGTASPPAAQATEDTPAAVSETPASKPATSAKPAAAAAATTSSPKPAPRPKPNIAPKPDAKVEKVVGTFNFEPENADELGFKKGDVIVVVEKVDEGWWIGELDGKRGLFPSNYTTPM